MVKDGLLTLVATLMSEHSGVVRQRGLGFGSQERRLHVSNEGCQEAANGAGHAWGLFLLALCAIRPTDLGPFQRLPKSF